MCRYLFVGVCILYTVSCRTMPKQLKYRQQMHMGTYISVGTPQLEDATAVFKIFRDLDHKWSTYKPSSLLSRINNHQTSAIDSQTFDILKLSEKMHEKTDLLFSISWVKHNISLKPGYELSFKKVNLAKGVRLNLGGIAKGYAIDRAVEYFEINGVSDYQISASGDIACGGQCELRVQHPFKEAEFASFISRPQGLRVSTSGNYRRYSKSSNNHHIKNPKTKKSSYYLASLTLFSSDDSAKLDALTTAGLATNSVKEFNELFAKFPDVAFLSVSNKGLVDFSPNIYTYINQLAWLDFTDLKRVTKQRTKNN